MPWLWKVLLLIATCLAQNEDDINTVYVVFMNHLDVGFDGIDPTIGYAVNVINKYFDDYYPMAINVSMVISQLIHQSLRQRGGPERLIYTTHPWLVAVYLTCPDIPNVTYPTQVSLHCPDAAAVVAFDAAVMRGDISWHAFPFNTEPEIMAPWLVEYSVYIAHWLDQRYGLAPKMTMSQRDVPGMTRSIIPWLLKSGVQAITVGVNGGSAPPAVPKAFQWQDPSSGESVIGMWHPGGYGGIEVSDCVIVPQLGIAMAPCIGGDNAGPPTEGSVLETFAQLKMEFPKANVTASTWDEFVVLLATVKEQLPVVTEEIGDTWIYGVQSDPLRTAMFRNILSVAGDCVASGECSFADPAFFNFSLMLVKIPEHTWGLDVKTFLHDDVNWNNVDFERVINQPNYKMMIESWFEQRAYLTQALAYAPPALQAKINARLQPFVDVTAPDLTGYTLVPNPTTRPLKAGGFTFQFSSTGGLQQLMTSDGTELASAENLLAQLSYMTYDYDQYAVFLHDYIYCTDVYFICAYFHLLDFGKPDLEYSDAQAATVLPSLENLYVSANGSSYLAQVSFPSFFVTTFGAPVEAWVQFDFAESDIAWTVTLINKTSTRLPETLWFSFQPFPNSTNPETPSVTLYKLTEPVDPMNIVLNGSRHIHVVDSVTFETSSTTLSFSSPDVAVVSIGQPNIFPTPLTAQPELSAGVHFNILNNIWGTNYIMWYPFAEVDKNLLTRFQLSVT